MQHGPHRGGVQPAARLQEADVVGKQEQLCLAGGQLLVRLHGFEAGKGFSAPGLGSSRTQHKRTPTHPPTRTCTHPHHTHIYTLPHTHTHTHTTQTCRHSHTDTFLRCMVFMCRTFRHAGWVKIHHRCAYMASKSLRNSLDSFSSLSQQITTAADFALRGGDQSFAGGIH